jgi:MFS family permease
MSPRTRFQRISAACTFDRLALVFVFSVIAVAAALSPMQSDTWWHLRAGADMVRTHRVLLTDTYSHTAYGMAWPNHEWLSQVIFFLVYMVGGLPLLSLFAASLIVGAWALVWRLCEGDGRQRLIVVALVLIPASLHWAPRPHAFSLLFVMATVTLVIANRLAWLPLIVFVWANCHGAVVLGFVVMAAAFAAALADSPRDWRRHAMILAACAAAATLTPLGISFWTEIPRSLARIRQYPIDEWRSPSLGEWPLATFWIAAALVAAGVALEWRPLRTRRYRATRIRCACALAVLPFAVTAIRNVGPFVMLAAPALCGLLELRRRGAEPVNARAARPEHPLINVAAMAAATILVVLTIGSAYRRHSPRLRWTPLPKASLQALQRCPDNLYNRYDEGGYLLWFAANRRVFLDGRQDPYPPPLIGDQLRIERSGEYSSTFDRYQIHCAYLPTSSPVATRLTSVGWRTLYRDPQWIVLAN